MLGELPAGRFGEVESLVPRIGASQVADAIGVGYRSPVRLWGELRRLPGFERPDETAAMRLGRALQPVIFAELAEQGYDATMFPHDPPEVVLCDSQRRWLIGHPDGECGSAVVEAKAQQHAHADLSAVVQTLVYMHLGGYDGGLIATLSGLHLEVTEVERDDARIEQILALADRFMQHVEEGTLPPIVGHPDDYAAVSATSSPNPAKRVRESREIREARRELAALKAQDGKQGARARRETELQARIVAYMDDAGLLVDQSDAVVARWTAYETTRLDTARLKKERPDVYALYATTADARRLTLT